MSKCCILLFLSLYYGYSYSPSKSAPRIFGIGGDFTWLFLVLKGVTNVSYEYDEQLENRSIDYLNNSVITYNKSMIYDFPLDYFFDGFYYYMTDLPLAVEMWASDNESSMIMNKSDKVGCAVKQWTQKVIVNSNLNASDYILKKEEELASERDMGLLACYFNFH